jgi:hypothetical protein
VTGFQKPQNQAPSIETADRYLLPADLWVHNTHSSSDTLKLLIGSLTNFLNMLKELVYAIQICSTERALNILIYWTFLLTAIVKTQQYIGVYLTINGSLNSKSGVVYMNKTCEICNSFTRYIICTNVA